MILLLLDSGINMVDDYDWKYCSGMHVGYTYELHWPHSNMGDCPTAANPWPKWQYQSHFMDGASHVHCPARTCGSSPRDIPVPLTHPSSPQRLHLHTPTRVTHLPSTVHTSTEVHTILRLDPPLRTYYTSYYTSSRSSPPPVLRISFSDPPPHTHTHLPRVCPRQACSAKPTRSLEPPLSRMKPLPSMRSFRATPTSQRAWSSSECTPR